MQQKLDHILIFFSGERLQNYVQLVKMASRAARKKI
jgi:hypothetical protein